MGVNLTIVSITCIIYFTSLYEALQYLNSFIQIKKKYLPFFMKFWYVSPICIHIFFVSHRTEISQFHWFKDST